MTACTTDPVTGKTSMNNTSTGALIGAATCGIVGAATHGSKGARNAALGCAAVGASVGAYMDYQEKLLKEELAGTGVSITRVGDELKLVMPEGITFSSGSAVLSSKAVSMLGDVSKVLATYVDTNVLVGGHTDSTGSASTNQKLSEDRANAVANVLRQNNVASSRLTTRGYSSSMPIASNSTTEGKAQNRRVEVTISPVTK
jgi:outer membrane protein OmpA-like peptidoglycan-associated protein